MSDITAIPFGNYVNKGKPNEKFEFISMDKLVTPEEVKPLEKGGCNIKPKWQYEDGKTGPLYLQLPPGQTPFGFSAFFDDKKREWAYSIALKMRSDMPFISELKTFMEGDIMDKLVDWVFANKVKCLGPKAKDWSKDQIRNVCNDNIRFPQDAKKAEDHGPTFKVNIGKILPKKEEDRKKIEYTETYHGPDLGFWAECEDRTDPKNPKKVSIEEVTQGSIVMLIIQLNTFYSVNQKPGMTWNLHKCIILKKGEAKKVNIQEDAYGGIESLYAPPPTPVLYDGDQEPEVIKRDREEEEGSANGTSHPAQTGSSKKSKKN